jgi:hypothetical protein
MLSHKIEMASRLIFFLKNKAKKTNNLKRGRKKTGKKKKIAITFLGFHFLKTNISDKRIATIKMKKLKKMLLSFSKKSFKKKITFFDFLLKF